MLINGFLNRQHEVPITSSTYLTWVGKTTQQLPVQVAVPCFPFRWHARSLLLPVELSPFYPCTTFNIHHWETFLHACPPKKNHKVSLSAGPDSWCLSTLKHFSDQGQPAPSQATVSRADCVCTLNDTPGTFQGYWESEQEVSWFKNGSPMLRGPAETRGQCATKLQASVNL